MAGGLLIGLTGGLAAPAVAAGLTAGWGALGLGSVVSIGATGAFLASTGGSALLGSLFGVGGMGLSGYRMASRIGVIKTFEFDLVRGGSGLSVCIGISGWLRSEEDVAWPWANSLGESACDLYALRWEPQLLLDLGSFLLNMVTAKFADAAAEYWIKTTVLASLSAALAWPMALISFANNLDNTWVKCRERAQQAGILLADAISDKARVGQRPVALVGYSMGARVIFFALQELWKRGQYNCVSDVVLMGLPASIAPGPWRRARGVVAGRLVNVYTQTDWVLGFLFRYMEWGVWVAGLRAVEGVPGVENYDVSGFVSGHSKYPQKVADILTFVGLEV